MFDGALNTPMNTAAKYLLNDYWWALENIGIKGAFVRKRLCYVYMLSTYSRVHFIQFCVVDFASRKTFLFISVINHFIGTAIAKSKCCGFLASMLNSIWNKLWFSWKIAPYGKVRFLFFRSFWLVLRKFSFWQEDWALVYNSGKFWDFPDFW